MLKNHCFKKYFNLNFIKKFILKNKIDLHKKNFHKKHQNIIFWNYSISTQTFLTHT